MPVRLVAFIQRFKVPLLVAWLVTFAAAAVAAMPLADRLSGGGWSVPGSGSAQAVAATESGFADRGATNVTLVVRDQRATAGSAEFDRRVAGVMRDVVADNRLAVTGTYGWQTLSPAARAKFVGEDGRTAITFVGLGQDDGTARRVLPALQKEIDDRYRPQGLRVSLVSASSLFGEVNKLSEDGLRTAEMFTLPLILFILLMLYRGAVSAVVSFVVSGTAIVFTFGVLSLLAEHVEVSIFAQNVATMIGLGVGVDYSLFVISRYVEERGRGHDPVTALVTTMRTSGRTVALAGTVVVLATACLLLVDLSVIRSIVLGIMLVVAFSVLASLVVLPLVILLLGDRLLRGRLPTQRRPAETRGARWGRLASRIMRRPVAFLTVAVVVMLALAAPALGMRTFTPDVRVVPASAPVRAGYDAINEQFGRGAAAPFTVVVSSAEPVPLTRLRDQLAGLPHVTRVESAVDLLAETSPTDDMRATIDHFVSTDRRTTVLEVFGDDDASGDRSRALLADIRSTVDSSGLRGVVGGETAEGVDANSSIEDGLLGVVISMLVVIYLLLLVTFRSILLPVKAILMNLLSVGATYGVLVLVFQHGFGSGVLGFDEFGHVQNFVPVMLLGILVGLSTDYEVFLLHRIKEEHDAGADDATGVARGMSRTAPLISGAAVLMIAVFGAFAFTGFQPIQQLGFGLALGIALDATLVRLVIVPAAMRLMGRWNWWLPGVRQAPRVPAAVTEEPLAVASSQGNPHD